MLLAGLVDGEGDSPEGGSPQFSQGPSSHGRTSVYTNTTPPDG